MNIRYQKFWGRTLAIATIGVASVALAGCSVIGNIIGGGTTTPGEGEDTDVFTIRVGDCLNDGGVQGEVSSVRAVDCSELHDSEAYASVIVDDGDFPGDSALNDQAISDCSTEFGSFVGLDYDSSELDFSYYYPTEESWGQGDREILCLMIDPSGQVTGSLRGAAR